MQFFLKIWRVGAPPAENPGSAPGHSHHYETLISLTLYPVVSFSPSGTGIIQCTAIQRPSNNPRYLNVTPAVNMETYCWTMKINLDWRTIEFIAIETEALFRFTLNYWTIKQEIRRRLWDSNVIKPVAMSTCHIVWQMNDSNFLLVKLDTSLTDDH